MASSSLCARTCHARSDLGSQRLARLQDSAVGVGLLGPLFSGAGPGMIMLRMLLNRTPVSSAVSGTQPVLPTIPMVNGLIAISPTWCKAPP